MKKINLKNIITVFILTVFFVTGISGNTVFCVSDSCCETEESSCCDMSFQNESITKKDCCEYIQTFQSEKKAVTTFINTIVVITPKTLIHHNSPGIANGNIIPADFSSDHIRTGQSKTILRI